MKQVWILAVNSLNIAYQKVPVNIHAFVLMRNHYHLVLDTPDANIDVFMYEFNKNFSLALRMATKTINRMFGGRYNWSVIKQREHYMNVLKYVFLNPVKAKICFDVLDYPYSSLNQTKLGKIPLSPFISPLNKGFLEWTRIGHSQKQQDSIKKGLVRKEFRYAGSRKVRKPPAFSIPHLDKPDKVPGDLSVDWD